MTKKEKKKGINMLTYCSRGIPPRPDMTQRAHRVYETP